MSKPLFTPAPWEFAGGGIVGMNGRQMDVICKLPPPPSDPFDLRIWTGNADLMVAAPAMRGAILGLLRVLPDSTAWPDDPSWCWAWDTLSCDAQDMVKAARRNAAAIPKFREPGNG